MLNQEEREELRKRIKENIEKIKVDIEELKELTKPIPPENAYGRISRMDAINNRSIQEASLRSSRSKLAKLEHALSIIDQPGFGICERCEQPIQTGRLLLMPESNRCIRCAKK